MRKNIGTYFHVKNSQYTFQNACPSNDTIKKRHMHSLGKMSASHISNNELIFRIHKELLKLNKKTNPT